MMIEVPVWVVLLVSHLACGFVGFVAAIVMGGVFLKREGDTETPSHDHL